MSQNSPRTDGAEKSPGRLALAFSPLFFAALIAAAALALRVVLPGGDPFTLYFEQYLHAGPDDEERARNLTARIAQLGSHAAGQIHEILNDDDAGPKQLEAAARLAGALDDPALRPQLAALVAPGQPTSVRIAALESLARLGGEVGQRFLNLALNDPNEQVRVAALGALGPASPAEFVPLLSKRARTATGRERAEAVAALGRAQVAPARRALWSLYQSPLPAPLLVTAKRALARYGAPDPEEREQLAGIAAGYLPISYRFVSKRARKRLERRLRTLLMYRLEDRLEELGPDRTSCDSEEECHAQYVYYRDLLRRKTKLELEVEGFLPLFNAPAARPADPLLLVRTNWLLGGKTRHLSLSLVRMLGNDPAIFPIRELGFETFQNQAGPPSEETRPAVGEVLRVSGRIRKSDLVVDLLIPMADLPLVERYRFEGGVFVLLPSGEF